MRLLVGCVVFVFRRLTQAGQAWIVYSPGTTGANGLREFGLFAGTRSSADCGASGLRVCGEGKHQVEGTGVDFLLTQARDAPIVLADLGPPLEFDGQFHWLAGRVLLLVGGQASDVELTKNLRRGRRGSVSGVRRRCRGTLAGQRAGRLHPTRQRNACPAEIAPEPLPDSSTSVP